LSPLAATRATWVAGAGWPDLAPAAAAVVRGAVAGFASAGFTVLAAGCGWAFGTEEAPGAAALSAGRAVAVRGGVAPRSLPLDGGALSATVAYPFRLLSMFSEKVPLCRANRRPAPSPQPQIGLRPDSRALQGSAEQIWRTGAGVTGAHPACGEIRARHWCRRIRMSSKAQY
jgi:hypothetical protein